MKRFFKKLFGYKYETWLFRGDCYGEFWVFYAITKPINSNSEVNPHNINSFKSSVVCIESKPYEWYKGIKYPIYTKEIPNKIIPNHVLIK